MSASDATTSSSVLVEDNGRVSPWRGRRKGSPLLEWKHRIPLVLVVQAELEAEAAMTEQAEIGLEPSLS